MDSVQQLWIKVRDDWTAVEEYLKEYIGDFYEIEETSEKIHISADFPDEYASSESRIALKGTVAKAKANAAQAIPELIQIATNPKHEINRKEKHKTDAMFGWYRYDIRFALPIYDDKTGKIARHNIYSATTAFLCVKLFTDTDKRIITFFLYRNICKFPFTTNEPAHMLYFSRCPFPLKCYACRKCLHLQFTTYHIISISLGGINGAIADADGIRHTSLTFLVCYLIDSVAQNRHFDSIIQSYIFHKDHLPYFFAHFIGFSHSRFASNYPCFSLFL